MNLLNFQPNFLTRIAVKPSGKSIEKRLEWFAPGVEAKSTTGNQTKRIMSVSAAGIAKVYRVIR